MGPHVIFSVDTPNGSISENGTSKSNGKQKENEGGEEPGIYGTFESWDYDICESTLLKEEENKLGYAFIVKKNVLRWIIMILVGVITGIFTFGTEVALETGSNLKHSLLAGQLNTCSRNGGDKMCFLLPLLSWTVINSALVLVASFLVTYVEPVAAGSGIPQLKCYLNGIKIPKLFRLKTLIVKAIAVLCSVIGGLAVGKEPAVTNCGAVAAAGISQGMLPSLKKDLHVFKYFREDREKRDFVSGGAAAGVAAAFGAPLGGLLFSLEEGASFWNQGLTWRMFVASLVTVFTMNSFLSTYHGHSGELSYGGLINYGRYTDTNTNYHILEIPIFLLMGAIGGLLGAFYNFLTIKQAQFRKRYLKSRFSKVSEAVFVAAVTAFVGMGMLYFLDDCNPLGDENAPEAETEHPVQMFCPDKHYSAIGSFWFQTPEKKIRSLFHDPAGTHNISPLLIWSAFYFILSCWTMGLSTGSGLYLPCLMIGGAWGRVVGHGVEYLFPNATWLNTGKYALIGGAAQLGGILRMTVCLTAIIVEGTGSLTFGLPIMLTLNVAKWVGDFFNEGFYDIQIDLKGIPLLGWDAPPLSRDIPATDVMASPVTTFSLEENVGTIYEALVRESHSGYPVVDIDTEDNTLSNGNNPRFGKFRGLILRSQLLIMLQKKMFEETQETWSGKCNLDMFREPYPRYPKIEDLHLSEEEMGYTMDLRPIMNLSPFTIPSIATLPRIFKLFRGLGLRHLVVVDRDNFVVGIVTRIDLARYKVETKWCKMKVKKVKVI